MTWIRSEWVSLIFSLKEKKLAHLTEKNKNKIQFGDNYLNKLWVGRVKVTDAFGEHIVHKTQEEGRINSS